MRAHAVCASLKGRHRCALGVSNGAGAPSSTVSINGWLGLGPGRGPGRVRCGRVLGRSWVLYAPVRAGCAMARVQVVSKNE